MAENQGKAAGATKAAEKDTTGTEAAEANAESVRISDERRQLVHAENVESDPVLTIEEAHEVGYFGRKVDPEPNDAYTLQGVTKGS
jgi:hypothetical protein